MTGLVPAAPHNSMIDLFARRSKVATRAIGIADVLTPVQVRVFADCEMRWFYEHLLAVPEPPPATMALHRAIRAAPITHFHHKLLSPYSLSSPPCSLQPLVAPPPPYSPYRTLAPLH